jgi:TonB family protein
MRTGLFGMTLATTIVLGGCGVELQKYNAQVARADKLGSHLKKTLDRLDYLEAKEALAQKKTRKARTGDVERMTRLATEIARVRTTLHRRERTLAACRATRTKIRRSPPISHTIRTSACDLRGVTVAVGQGLLVRTAGPATQRSRARTQIRAALSKELAAITQCYLKATQRKKRAIPGRLVVTLRVDKRGRAKGVKAAHRGLRARRVVKCVLKTLRGLRVVDLKGPAFAVVPLRFGRSKVFVRSTRCGGRAHKKPSRAILDRICKRHRSEIQYCFISSGLPAKKLRKARVKVAFTVLASGKVGPVSLVSSTDGHATTNACILRAVKRWRFPRPKGNTPLMTPEFRWRKAPGKRRRRRRRRPRRRRNR